MLADLCPFHWPHQNMISSSVSGFLPSALFCMTSLRSPLLAYSMTMFRQSSCMPNKPVSACT